MNKLIPIRTSNMIAVSGFGYNVGLKISPNDSKSFYKYIENVKIFFLKNNYIDWNVFYDKNLFTRIIIYNRKLIQNTNNIIYNLRTSGNSFVRMKPDNKVFLEACIIKKELLKEYSKINKFINEKPEMCEFTYFRYKYMTKIDKKNNNKE